MGQRREAFAARREMMGYTQEGLAAAVGVEFCTVGRWERGDLTPQPHRRPRIAKALGISLEELGALLVPATGRDTPAPHSSTATPPLARDAVRSGEGPPPRVDGRVHGGGAIPAQPDSAEADEMNRRDLLRLFTITGAALATPAGQPALPEGDTIAAAARSGRVDAAAASEFAALNSHLWRMYAMAPTKSQVLPLVRAQLDALTAGLRHPQNSAIHQRLCALSSELFQLTGEIFLDADRYTDAAHCYTLAATAGQEANSPDLWACALIRHAFIVLYERRFAEAAPLLELAGAVAERGDPTLSTRHWVAAVRAGACAGLGDLNACERALDAAAEVHQLRGPVHNGGWLRFDGSRLAEERGSCYVTLGRYDRAEEALGDALAGSPTARRKAGVLTDLAVIGVHRRDHDQVIAYANAAVATARRTGSGVVNHKLRGLQSYLDPLLVDQRIQRLDADISDIVGTHAA